jgi:hypothetical protein
MKSDKLKALMKEADIAWSQAIRRIYKDTCLYSKKVGTDPHHIHPRDNLSVRWELMNGVLLNHEFHTESSVFSAHGTPKKFKDWIRGEMGFEAYDRLEKKSREVFRPTERDMEEIIQGLTEWV